MQKNSFLTIAQELELLSSLESHGSSPLKFAYLWDGYLKWVKIANLSRKTKGVTKIENDLLVENLPFIFNELKKHDTREFNIVDLGCGDGTPIETVFLYLKNNGFFEKYKINYLPFDISQNMLDHASNYISKKFDVNIKPTLIDFEKGSFPEILLSWTNKKSYNYCFFLGNTLGNFSDTWRIISNFKDSLFSTDYLIISNELSNLNAINKIVEYYEKKQIYEMSSNAIKQFGYKDSDGTYNVRWNNTKKQIEGYVVLKKDIVFNISNSKIKFKKNEEIELYISKKFVEEDMVKIFNEIWFRVHLFTTNKEKRHCLLSINPSRYRTN